VEQHCRDSARGVEGVARPNDAEPGFLQQIFCDRSIPAPSNQKAEQAPPKSIEKQLESSQLTALHPYHQVLVGC
jgi:hypothetical protein